MAVGGNPLGINTIVPLLDVSGHYQVSYGRDPKSYPLNQYTSQTVCSKPMGSYLKFSPKDAHRSPDDARWALGTPRPRRANGLQDFSVQNFVADRYSFEAIIDGVSVDVADFDVVKIHTEKLAREAMITRTKNTLAAILPEANYDASHIATAAALGGGFLNAGTTANPILQTALQEAALVIQKDTGGIGGKGREISILLSNKMAMKLGRSREVREFMMQQTGSPGLITGEDALLFAQYGLPPRLFGFPVVIEDTYANVGTKENATSDVNSFVDSTLDNAIFLFVRDGDLAKGYMAGGFSSWTQFVYEDFKTITWKDEYNDLTYYGMTDYFVAKVTAPETVVKINNVLS